MKYTGILAAWLLLAAGLAPGAEETVPNPPTKPAQAAEPRVMEDRNFAGVPVHIVRPAKILPSSRLIVLFHGYGSPASPQELARALPLERSASLLAYVNLPMVASRLPSGGLEELRRLQKENFVNGFFFPSIHGAATELQPVVKAIAAEYHLDLKGGIGLFGFSAGGAAALLSLIESDVPVQAAVILNAPVSVTENVENWEHALGLHFQWDEASREAAVCYDVARQATRIGSRQPIPALLLLQGGADKSLGIEPGRQAFASLQGVYGARGQESRVEFRTVAGLGHQFGPDVKENTVPAANGPVRWQDWIEDWFRKYLV